ncbi:MAG: NAD-dependent epimerase/dehydratase family protein, partial [Burkholderiales bacterium]|nr:NAD-dependent epimerase/dehydratase family protein [Burkholderiales bacterium]
MSKIRVLVTGANGFIGKNLVVRLRESPDYEILTFVRGQDIALLPDLVVQADAIVHLAGENRPAKTQTLADVNTGLTIALCDALRSTLVQLDRKVPLLLASSTKAECDNPYGHSKRAAELAVEALARDTQNSVMIFRLPGVFGKWCKPNYNSVVATFCHNIARDLPIQINDPSADLHLVYIDNVVDEFLRVLNHPQQGLNWGKVLPVYSITVGDLAEQIRVFQNCRTSLMSERVGTGLIRALYSTYISYLPPERFAYELPQYGDERGVIIERLKTPECG